MDTTFGINPMLNPSRSASFDAENRSHFSARCAGTIGHTGFTGTGLWLDFQRGLAWSLLTNRVHPSRHKDSGILALRRATGEQVIALFDRRVTLRMPTEK